ncbi:hypothetical protein OKW48_004585 [Paraburkholderia youngii]
MLHAARVQHDRKLAIGQLGRGLIRAREKLRPAARGRKSNARAAAIFSLPKRLAHAVIQIAKRIALGRIRRRDRPLQRCVLQAAMTRAAQIVAGRRVRRAREFGEHFVGARIAERIGKAHFTSDARDDLPVGQRRAGRFDGLLHQRQIALRVDHHAFGFGPQSAWQQHVGVAIRFGVEERVLRDHEFGRAQSGDRGLPVGDGRDRIRADDPARLDVARGHAREQVDRAVARIRFERARCDAPQRFDERAIFSDQRRTLTRQTGAHVAHFAAAHRVRLARQRERSTAAPADTARRQMQIAQRIGVPRAVRALVQAHRPAAHPVFGRRDHLRGATDVAGGKARDACHVLRRVLGQKRGHRVPAFGVFGDKRRIGCAAFVQQMQQTVQQREVGAGFDLQEQIGFLGGRVAARIDDDQLRARLHAIHHAQEQDRMTVGHIRAADEKQIRVIEVFIRAGRAVRTERQLVAARRARHAQARIRFDIVRADKALRELVDQILRFERHLPRHVKRHRIGTMLVDHTPQTRRGVAQRLRHRQRRRVFVARMAHERAFETPRLAQRDVSRLSLGAEPAKVGRMLLVAGDLHDLAVLDVQHHAATDAAIRTHALYAGIRHARMIWLEL